VKFTYESKLRFRVLEPSSSTNVRSNFYSCAQPILIKKYEKNSRFSLSLSPGLTTQMLRLSELITLPDWRVMDGDRE
jgi:hypothetical protein